VGEAGFVGIVDGFDDLVIVLVGETNDEAMPERRVPLSLGHGEVEPVGNGAAGIDAEVDATSAEGGERDGDVGGKAARGSPDHFAGDFGAFVGEDEPFVGLRGGGDCGGGGGDGHVGDEVIGWG